eukprot:CAMPEP_0196653666 /NCGR_PEP_ID=MMETSP1086-20130531/3322_1 /TAXON_ID=77921 /ORGANISM="Cyanoptyche  gloeocystis , Strain SAG4.97" /LENGTH=108 /DNA_ID=CAMNT_0041984981 /DNA_START=287 /DNA_END=613 /DNA_ORIENTATION=-
MKAARCFEKLDVALALGLARRAAKRDCEDERDTDEEGYTKGDAGDDVEAMNNLMDCDVVAGVLAPEIRAGRRAVQRLLRLAVLGAALAKTRTLECVHELAHRAGALSH